jgi:hypothetical protein
MFSAAVISLIVQSCCGWQSPVKKDDTSIHKQAQDKTPFPITNLSGGAAQAVPDANPTSPHKKAANALLKASIDLAKANALERQVPGGRPRRTAPL